MNTIVEHLVTIVSIQGMKVDYLQTEFCGYLLLDRDDLVLDHLVADIPS